MSTTENSREQWKQEVYKRSNAIAECSRILSKMIWDDETIPKQFVLAGLADAVQLSANELEELLDAPHAPRWIGDNNRQDAEPV